MARRLTIGGVLFHEFELLDLFGPFEMFGLLPEQFELRLVSENGDNAASSQGPVSVVDYSFDDSPQFDLLLDHIPTQHLQNLFLLTGEVLDDDECLCVHEQFE